MLACVCAAAFSTDTQAQRVPLGTNEIAFADFSTAVPSWDYGYFYSDGDRHTLGATYSQDRFYGEPPDMTNTVFRYTFDATVFDGFTSWWGTGFGMPVPWTNDPAVFNSADPADYILTFDAKAEGFSNGVTSARSVMEFRLGTAGENQWVMVKALPYTVSSNWTHYRFTLDDGTWISADGVSTSYEKFTNGIVVGIEDVQFNQNQPEPREYGPDWDNYIYLDNIKLEVLQYAGPPPPPPPKVGLTVMDYNFDDKGLWWVWPNYPETTTGWSANANKATYWGLNPVAGAGLNGSAAFAIAMDNTLIAVDPPGVPAWAGGNASAGGAVNLGNVNSADLKDYLVTLSARAAGLLDEINGNTPFVLQIIFNAPDDTLQPADENTGADLLLRLNGTFSEVKSNWTAFSKSLKDFNVDSGSLANFSTHLSKLSEIQFQLQIQNPHNQSTWGTDADNQILVDDLKMVRLVVGTPPLATEVVGTNLKLTWEQPSSGTVKLMSGNSPDAITTEVVGATSPYTVPITGAAKFYRTQWVPPAQ